MAPLRCALPLLLLSACGPSTLVVTMNAENNSGESGTATFTQLGGDTRLEIDLTPGNDTGPQAAHVHTGRCGEIGPVVGALPSGRAIAIEPVVNGKSVSTFAGVSFAELKGGKYAVNVHYSRDSTLYVSCGNIP